MVHIKTQKEIQIMKEGGAVLARILQTLAKASRPGITTENLNKFAEELVFKFRVKPSFLNYRGYPAVLCTSINEEIVHGLPSDRKLKEGDLVTIDMGVLHKGFHTDSAVTVLVSNLSKVSHIFRKEYYRKRKLMGVTRKALEIGIKQATAGNTLGDIGSAIQKYVERERYNVVRDLVGHGIGREIHESPEVPNYLPAGRQVADTPKLIEGMVIAIEPMVVAGRWETEEAPDGFAFKTKDGSLSAHFEHTVAITAQGPLVLTR